MGKRAFTLAETMVALAVVGLLVGVGLLSFRQTLARQGSRGMAQILASDLRSARALAQSKNQFVSIGFPNEGHTIPTSASYVLKEGIEAGRTTRVHRLEREFDSAVFVGTWPSAVPMAPSQAKNLTASDSLVPSVWLGGSQEYTLIFGPDGSMVSNGLPTINGEVALLVVSSLTASPGPSGFFQASAAGDPMTVLVSPTGVIRVVEGAYQASGLAAAGDPLQLASPPELASNGSATPRIVSVEFLPSRNPALGHTSLSRTYIEIHPDAAAVGAATEYGLATLQITATDGDGGPLYFEVSSEGSDGSQGSFTTPAQGRMEWLGQNFQAQVSWRPPPEALPGTRYAFRIEVSDQTGLMASATTGAGLLPELETLRPGRLVVESYAHEVRIGNLEGIDLVKITPDGQQDTRPRFTYDGTRLVTFGGNAGLDLYLLNADGTDRQLAKQLPADAGDFDFDPTSTFLAYTHDHRTVLKDSGEVDLNGDPIMVEVEVFTLSAIHITSREDLLLSPEATDSGSWDPVVYKTYVFSSHVSGNGQNVDHDVVTFGGYPPTIQSSNGQFTTGYYDRGSLFNPIFHDYAARVEGGQLTLETTSASEILLPNVRIPLIRNEARSRMAWSGDGRFLVFVDNSVLKVLEVFNDSGARLTGSTPVEIVSGDESYPRLSADGRQAYYLARAGNRVHLFRVPVIAGATPVNLTERLGGALNYDITQ